MMKELKHMDVFSMKKNLEVIEITLSVTWMVGKNVIFFSRKETWSKYIEVDFAKILGNLYKRDSSTYPHCIEFQVIWKESSIFY